MTPGPPRQEVVGDVNEAHPLLAAETLDQFVLLYKLNARFEWLLEEGLSGSVDELRALLGQFRTEVVDDHPLLKDEIAATRDPAAAERSGPGTRRQLDARDAKPTRGRIGRRGVGPRRLNFGLAGRKNAVRLISNRPKGNVLAGPFSASLGPRHETTPIDESTAGLSARTDPLKHTEAGPGSKPPGVYGSDLSELASDQFAGMSDMDGDSAPAPPADALAPGRLGGEASGGAGTSPLSPAAGLQVWRVEVPGLAGVVPRDESGAAGPSIAGTVSDRQPPVTRRGVHTVKTILDAPMEPGGTGGFQAEPESRAEASQPGPSTPAQAPVDVKMADVEDTDLEVYLAHIEDHRDSEVASEARSIGAAPAESAGEVAPGLPWQSELEVMSLARLRAAEVPGHRRYVGMEGPGAQRLRELVGPDIFGRRIPAAARPFMTGFYDGLPAGTMPGLARQLPPAKVAGFLRNLSMTHAAPDRRDMDLSMLASAPVASAHRDPRLRDWARPEPSAGVTGPERVPRLETDVLEAPLVVPSIWLGSPLSDKSNMDEAFNRKVAQFWENLATAARTYRGVVDIVLFTDIGREVFDRVRGLADRPADDAYLAEVWDMLTRARGDGRYTVHLVNVDEVFNEELVSGAAGVFDPELATLVGEMFAVYRMEADSPGREGLGKASDILRTLVGLLLGVLYTDGDNILDVSLSAAEMVRQMDGILADRRGFAMEHAGSAFFAPAGHPFLLHHLRELRRRYDLTVGELFGGGDRGARERGQRRSSTTDRTGIMSETADHLFGTQAVPEIDFIMPQSAGTWTAKPPGRGWPADPQRALANAKRYVSALIRQLFRRDGALDLLAVADAIALEPDPEEMWFTVLRYLADSPFASLVTKVVDGRIERLFPVGETSPVIPVDLPLRAANLLDIDTNPTREARDLGGRLRPREVRRDRGLAGR